MNKPIVLCDLDGVIFNLHKRVAETFGAHHKLHVPANSFSHYSPSKGLEVPGYFRDYISACVKEYIASKHFYSNLEIIEGAQEGIQKLVDAGMEVIILSSFGDVPSCVPDKAWALDKHFPMLEKHNRIFTGKKSLVYGDYFIDDSPTHLAEWSKRYSQGNYGGTTCTLALPYTKFEDAHIFAPNWESLVTQINLSLNYRRAKEEENV